MCACVCVRARACVCADTDTLTISAVVPLFHETPLGPLLEVAMTMISKVRPCSWRFLAKVVGVIAPPSCGTWLGMISFCFFALVVAFAGV